MKRRHRRASEIPFSLDSFLDVIANVVGIIIKLILVAWVGARSYGSINTPPPDQPIPVVAEPTPPLSVTDELALRHKQIEQAQARLLDQLRQLKEEDAKAQLTREQLDALAHQQMLLDQENANFAQAKGQQGATVKKLEPTLQELRERTLKVREELLALEKLPPLKKTLTYRTPVSRPVEAEELHFELQKGRVTFIDVTAFLREIQQGIEERGQQLRERWEIEETTAPIGDFRLRYVFERERGGLEGASPSSSSNFRYGLSRWQVEPTTPTRGETAAEALTKGSAFRQAVDGADGQFTVITLWVYQDSFALYRELRDYLQRHDLEVAGRALPMGVPIASSRQGTASRGQ